MVNIGKQGFVNNQGLIMVNNQWLLLVKKQYLIMAHWFVNNQWFIHGEPTWLVYHSQWPWKVADSSQNDWINPQWLGAQGEVVLQATIHKYAIMIRSYPSSNCHETMVPWEVANQQVTIFLVHRYSCSVAVALAVPPTSVFFDPFLSAALGCIAASNMC